MVQSVNRWKVVRWRSVSRASVSEAITNSITAMIAASRAVLTSAAGNPAVDLRRTAANRKTSAYQTMFDVGQAWEMRVWRSLQEPKWEVSAPGGFPESGWKFEN